MAREIEVKNPLFQVGKIQAQPKKFEDSSTQDNKKDSQQDSVKDNKQDNTQGSVDDSNKDSDKGSVKGSEQGTTQYTNKYTVEVPVVTESYSERLVANVTRKQKKYVKDMAKKFENESAFVRFMLDYFIQNIEIK